MIIVIFGLCWIIDCGSVCPLHNCPPPHLLSLINLTISKNYSISSLAFSQRIFNASRSSFSIFGLTYLKTSQKDLSSPTWSSLMSAVTVSVLLLQQWKSMARLYGKSKHSPLMSVSNDILERWAQNHKYKYRYTKTINTNIQAKVNGPTLMSQCSFNLIWFKAHASCHKKCHKQVTGTAREPVG